jgi:hypothetical protein
MQHVEVYRTHADGVLIVPDQGGSGTKLAQFRQAVDDSKPDLITDLHLHHFSRQAGSHTLSIFQLELDLPSATFDEMKEEHRRKPLQFLVGGILAHVEDLRHADKPF